MLRLPPALRTILAARLYGILSRDHVPTAASTILLGPHEHLWRHYATIHVPDRDRSWEGSGGVGSQPAAALETSTATVTDQIQDAMQAHQRAATPAESQKLQVLDAQLRRRVKSKSSIRRPRLRARILAALKSTDVLSELEKLLNGRNDGNSKIVPDRSSQKASPGSVPQNSASSAQTGQPQTQGVSHELSSSQSAMEKSSDSYTSQLLDIDHIWQTRPLPSKEQYPSADPSLFVPKLVASAVHNACAKLKIPMHAETEFKSKDGLTQDDLKRIDPSLQSNEQVKVCSLTLDIPEICHEHATGEGIGKSGSKQAAWLQIISQLHLNGTLKELFPGPEWQMSEEDSSGGPIEAIEAIDKIPSPTDVDKRTLESEKDAKVDIYNYAAGFGLVPHFETKVVRPRALRARRGRKPTKPAQMVQVTITVEEMAIKVTAVGKNLASAEIAAAVLFKKEAETRHKDICLESLPSADGDYESLNVDTGKSFFEFYKTRENGLSLEIEYERIEGVINQNQALLTVNGRPVGEAVIMSSKKQAEEVAYLTAAVHLSRSQPDLLADFNEALKRGNGKVLRSLKSIDLHAEFVVLQRMRDGLSEARQAGLPSVRQTLNAESRPSKEQHQPRRMLLQPDELAQENRRLQEQQERLDNDPELAQQRSKRQSLPMTSYRNDVLRLISNNIYSIIIGATGSGKTTQVPQIIFEDEIGKSSGVSCNVICTQPRRIAATSVARRVSNERNEPLRTTVGYHVRFDSQLPRKPYGISYCTTGILLERLKHDSDAVLDTTSHIIIDEVHERDLNIDFLMIVLKKAIKERQVSNKSVPRVVLMSATLDPELFSRYFGHNQDDGSILPCPSLSVPGRTFPVRERYLGSIIDELMKSHGSQFKEMWKADPNTSNFIQSETAFSAQQDGFSQSEAVIDWKRDRSAASESEGETSTMKEKEEALVPISLVVATIAHVSGSGEDGAILVFLPGLEEILQVQKMLMGNNVFGIEFGDPSKFKMCLLHSSVPKEQQAEIFETPEAGCRKIILSTNIAETSVTVPDIKFVLDTGKHREIRYDQTKRITRLQCVWESKSNLRQRAGRAGRVQEGYYYGLFSKERADSLRAVGLPELLRSDLQETCLSIKAQNFNESTADFLAQAIEPPSKNAVEVAVKNLIAIEAFTADESMTSLGRVLSKLPVHPALGKMIILGIIFRCLDPMLILGAAAEERSLFVKPIGSRAEAQRAHQSYSRGQKSDHLAVLEAFKELRWLRTQHGDNATWQRAREKFLHMGAFNSIDQTARQIQQVLVESKLISRNYQDGQSILYGPADLNENSSNPAIIKCLLLAGLLPNLAVKSSESGMTYRTPTEQAALTHPSSLNADRKDQKQQQGSIFVYAQLSKSSDGNSLFMRDTTFVTPLMVILFGGAIQLTKNGQLEMDEWLPFFVKWHDWRYASKMILEYRKGLDRVLFSAFNKLSGLGKGDEIIFEDDPIRERFARNVIEILEQAEG